MLNNNESQNGKKIKTPLPAALFNSSAANSFLMTSSSVSSFTIDFFWKNLVVAFVSLSLILFDLSCSFLACDVGDRFNTHFVIWATGIGSILK